MGGPSGVTVRLRYIHHFKDRHGVERFYFRRHGKRAPLPGKPGEAQFMEAYHEATRDAPPSPTPRAPAAPGSIASLVQLYLTECLAHLQNKPRTRHVTKLILERFAAKHGHRLVAQMKTEHVEKILAGMINTPAAANDLLKKLHRLMAFAIKRKWIVANPTAGIKPFKEGTHHTWTDEQIAQFEARWLVGTKERTAFALHLWTAQRLSDVRQMTWNDVGPKSIRVVQQKGGAKLAIPIRAELKAALAAHPKTQSIILPTAFGKPFTEKGFGQWMARAIEAAGLPEECVTHGLRKAAARRLAESGASAKEIGAVTGHKTLKEVARYTADADQARLAEAAMARLPANDSGTSVANPDAQVAKEEK